MPQPASQDVHIDEVMTDFTIAYMQSQDVFISTKVFPIISVGKQSNKYITWDRNDWLRDEAQKRADATESYGSGYRFSTDNYYADVWAFHKDVGAQARHNQDGFVDLDSGALRFVGRKMLLRQEIQWVTDFFTTGVWATDYTVPVQWHDVTSDPIEDFDANRETMLTTTGFEPNTAVFGYTAFRRLSRHPDIVDRLSSAAGLLKPSQVTPAMVAQILGLDRIFVAKAIKATNVEGETAAYSLTHGKHVWLGYVSPTPAGDEPSAGYIFGWDYAGYSEVIGVNSIEMPLKKATRYEGEAAWDGKVTASDLGVFMPSVVP